MTTRIGIISDTHGKLRDEVIKRLETCDYIFHCGDFDNKAIVKQLKAIGELVAIRGNNDFGAWAIKIPYSRYVAIDGVRFFMVHDRYDVPNDIKPVDVILFGHSHEYFQEKMDGVMWLNPGSCGKPRFNLDLTMAIMTIADGRYEIEKFDVSKE